MLADRVDLGAEWRKAQAAAGAPAGHMSMAELDLAVRHLQFDRAQEATHLASMWETGNHNAHLLAVLKAELGAISATVESLTAAAPQAASAVNELKPEVELVKAVVESALSTVEKNDVYIKQECKDMGGRLERFHGLITEHSKNTDERLDKAKTALETLEAHVLLMQEELQQQAAAAAAAGPAGAAASGSAGAPAPTGPSPHLTLLATINANKAELSVKVKDLQDRAAVQEKATMEVQERIVAHEAVTVQLQATAGCPCMTDKCPCMAKGCGSKKADPWDAGRDPWSGDDGGDGNEGGDDAAGTWGGVPHFEMHTPPPARGRPGDAPKLTFYSRPLRQQGER